MKKFSSYFSVGLILIVVAGIINTGFKVQAETQHITWKDLQDVRFKKKFNKQENMFFLYPEFGERVKALEGKVILIRGYMIPVDPAENVFVLSANPMAACFFCGGSGPESIIQLKLKQPRRFATDEIWTVKGILKLNIDNVEELNYVLQNTEPIKKFN
ncbi:DUF3299 domain-containing protein [Emticicia fluvialis]|uniref:DUF3299 domain-containing protein n=1 Tax=Emticicia fluvialis TaxID=2974474 RepID=UPI00216658C6|nr:DUF3299 domain-containing protein [Emticicia fluvialis]